MEIGKSTVLGTILLNLNKIFVDLERQNYS